MESDFIRRGATSEELFTRPYDALRFQEIIVRSVDDNSYPESPPRTPGISSWFKIDPWGFYPNGFEVVLGCATAVQDQSGHWQVVRTVPDPLPPGLRWFNVYQLGQIPWRNIVGYDVAGDQSHGLPVLYCSFSEDGQPYEGFSWVLTTVGEHLRLRPEKSRRLVQEQV
jgi:hypothetical protein